MRGIPEGRGFAAALTLVSAVVLLIAAIQHLCRWWS